MKAALHETHLDCYRKAFQDEKMMELTGETVVPDKMPDIGLLGDTNAHVILRVKRTEDGLCVLEGDLHATVCYLPDGMGGCCSIDLTIPWQTEFVSGEINDRTTAVSDVRVVQLETRMINPRKILVKAQICAEITIYKKETVVVCDKVEDISEIQTRQRTVECSVIGTVCEKTFVATDEYPLPAALHGGKVLCKSVRLRLDDVKTLTNKLIVKGSVLSDVVMITEQGAVEQVSFTSGFSFIAETDCETVSADVKSVLMPTGMFYEVTSNGQMLSVEVHGVCQMAAYAKQTLTYLADAYSNFYECKTEIKNLPIFTDTKNSTQRETVNVSIPVRSQISEILFAAATLGFPIHKDKSIQVPLSVSVCLKYENGTLDWAKKVTTAEFKTKETERMLSVRAVDPYSVSNGNEAVIRVSLEAELREEREEQLQMLSSIETDEEHPYCLVRPSITAVRRGGSLWDLAREFGSTVELIQQYNQLEENEVPHNTLLLIPKQNK